MAHNSQVWLTNLGDEPYHGWTMSWIFAGDEQITDLWSGRAEQTGAAVEVTNVAYNARIRPGERATFGFVGSTSGRALDVHEFRVDGRRCAIGA